MTTPYSQRHWTEDARRCQEELRRTHDRTTNTEETDDMQTYPNQAQNAGLQSQPREVPRIEGAANRFEDNLKRLDQLVHRLGAAADRNAGSVPEGIEKGAPNGPPTTSVARIEADIDGLEMLLRRLDSVTSRLETL